MDTLWHRFGPLSQNAIQLEMPPFDPKAKEYCFILDLLQNLIQNAGYEN